MTPTSGPMSSRSQPPGQADIPERPLLRLPHQRPSLPQMAGLDARAAASAARPLGQIRCPSSFGTGVLSPRRAKAEVHVPRCGHFALDAAADQIAQLVRGFMKVAARKTACFEPTARSGRFQIGPARRHRLKPFPRSTSGPPRGHCRSALRPGPYMIRVKVPSGVKLMPHRHPEDRVYTVMSGVFYIGLGDQFDGDQVEAYPAVASSFCPRQYVPLPLGKIR